MRGGRGNTEDSGQQEEGGGLGPFPPQGGHLRQVLLPKPVLRRDGGGGAGRRASRDTVDLWEVCFPK